MTCVRRGRAQIDEHEYVTIGAPEGERVPGYDGDTAARCEPLPTEERAIFAAEIAQLPAGRSPTNQRVFARDQRRRDTQVTRSGPADEAARIQQDALAVRRSLESSHRGMKYHMLSRARSPW